MARQSHTFTLVTPATPTRALANVAPALATIASGGLLAGVITPRGVISFEADPANTAGKSIVIGGPAMNLSTGADISVKLLPGATWSPGQVTSDLGDYYFASDSVNITEQVHITVI